MNAREPNVREPSTAAVTLRGDLVCTPDISHEPPGYTIEDPLRGKFYRVGVPEWTFLQLLDGRTSIAEAVGRAAGKLGPQALAEHEALALCRWLLDCQLAYPAGSDQAARLAEAARRDERRRMLAALNPLAIQIPLLHPDRLLARLSRGLDWIFSGWFFAAWSVAVVYAMYLAVAGWDRLTEMSTVILDRDNWLRLAAAWLLLKVLHELAHGLACKRYGGNVPTAGITLILFFPLAYVDVTSSWRFRSKWQRIVTAAAGMYVEWFVAALAMIVWSSASPGLVQHMALNVAVTAGLSTVLFNGNPLVRFDGYFIASDLAGVPNLYSCSQQYLVACIQKYVLGSPTPSPAWPAGRAWLIRLYAPAALAWRVFFYLALALTLVGRFSHFGAALALAMLGLAWGVPLVQIVRRAARTASLERVHWTRIGTAAAIGGLAAVAALLLLTRPGGVEAPAVVEYAPLTVVRAATPGFVQEIRVAAGRRVRRGEVIAVLRNAELQAELADLELALQQSIIRARVHLQNDELPKQQVELAQQQALTKKIAQTRGRADALWVRASCDGRVVARDLDSLVGRYLEEGREIAVLGREDAKELIVAVPQDDVDLFDAHRRAAGEVEVRTRSGQVLPARMAKVNPRASTELPHPALAAAVGGPLAVQAADRSGATAPKADSTYELLSPVFLGTVSLSPEWSAGLHPGQLTTVRFRSPSESVAARWFGSVRKWILERTSSPPGT